MFKTVTQEGKMVLFSLPFYRLIFELNKCLNMFMLISVAPIVLGVGNLSASHGLGVGNL